ncbi:serine/threonine-protein kinase [Streptomyces sp. NBC_00841]|uniref:serine/threonine-protein kinase n=1 Tax=Streptomyces sp. NBC_00841 TaxID=2975847 RepID=UPI002DD9CAA0|nr:serine/threonine-protein kinase [Streptomyces sp. NBC_00841]WRZ97317.1 serine/threonine-protein kinase [Streptomyces sp. NBC_00841]
MVAFVGRGGMGEVWEGRDRVIERRVAVKLLPHDRRDASGAKLFFREARTAGRLNHAGVVTVFDLGQDPDHGTLYLVMEFLTGRDLDTVLREDGAPQVATAVDWAAQTAEALKAAHAAGIVHRDLKPANLMLAPDGRIKILDFGIARYIASTHKSSKVIGTLAYMPPERFGDVPAESRSDLYSLGCVLHELLTGSTPFQAAEPVAMMAAHLNTTPEPPGRARPGVPAALDDLVMALLAKDPGDRPSSAAEVRDRLRELSAVTPASGAGSDLSGADTKTVTTPLTGAGPGAAQTPVPVPGPGAGTPMPTGRISRRTALRLGIGASITAALGTGVAAAVNLFDHNTTDHKTPKTPDPRLRWRYATGDAVTSSPAVVDGGVYIGSTDGSVYALHVTTGKKKWAYATGDKVEGMPAVVDGLVYIGSTDGSVYALDAATGERKWAYATGDKFEAAPTAVDGMVYIAGNNSVTALNAATGNEKWAVSCDSGLESPAVVDGVVYIAGYNSVTALNAATGNEKWVRRASDWGFDRKDEWDNTPEDWRFTPPTVADGVVYIGSSKRVYALDAVTGKKRWAFDTGGTVEGTPTVTDKVVYVGCSSKRVYALDAVTGKKRWAFDTGGTVGGTPTVADGVVYIGSFDHNVYALDAVTGNKKWSYATGGRVRSSPAVVDGVVYVGSQDHNVYALDVTIEGSSA